MARCMDGFEWSDWFTNLFTRVRGHWSLGVVWTNLHALVHEVHGWAVGAEVRPQHAHGKWVGMHKKHRGVVVVRCRQGAQGGLAHEVCGVVCPPPPPPLQCPPPGGGGGHFTVLLANIYCGGLCSHLSHTRSCIAFPLLRISHLCVFCDILSPKVVYRVLCPFFRPKMFSPGDRVWDHSRTVGAHVLATVVGP